MAKVVRLFNEREKEQIDLIGHIENLLEMAKNGEITSLAVAANSEDGNVMTGYFNLDVGEKQFLCGHIQTDIMFEVVKVNADQLIEWIE